MKEIVLIAPCEKMYGLSLELRKQHGYTNVDVAKGDLREGVRVANQVVDAGAKMQFARRTVI